MASKAKAYPYAIYRTDNSYLVYDLTKADYQKIQEAISKDHRFVEISIGFLNLTDIRAIIKQRPVEQKQEKPALPELTAEDYLYLKTVLGGMYSNEEVDE